MSKLPMDLSKFRKIGSDKNTSTFKHHEGHTITIAHNKLSTKMREKLHSLPTVKPTKMADGGEIKDDVPEAPQKNAQDMQKGATESGWQPSQWAQNIKQGAQAFADGGVPEDPTLGMPSVTNPDPNSYVRPDDSRSFEDKLKNVIYGGGQAPPQYDDQSSAPSQDNTQTDRTPSSQSAPTQNDNTTLGGPVKTGTPGMSDLYGTQGQLSALSQQQQANQQMAGAQGNLGQAQADVAKNYQTQAQQQMADYQNAMKPFIAQNDAISKDIAAGHVDPKRFVSNMKTGDKISTGIGLILGGMGAGLTKSPDLAFQYLQNQIDRDIDSQKQDLGKKNNLLAHNIQMMGNLRAGTEMTRLQQYNIVQSQLQQEAAKAQGPIAQAGAASVNAQIESQKAQIAHQGAIYNMMDKQSGNGGINPAMAIKMIAPPAQQEALMKDLKTKLDMDANTKNMMDAYDFVAKNNTLLNKANPQAQSLIDAEWQPKMVKLAHESAGRFNLEELPIMDKYKPNILDTQGTIEKKRNAFLQDMTSRANFPSLAPYGVRSGAPQQQTQQIQFKPTGKK